MMELGTLKPETRNLFSADGFFAAQAVEGAHLLTKPVDVPLIYLNHLLGFAGDAATEVGEGEAGRFVPDSADFAGGGT